MQPTECEKYATSRIETFAISRSKGIHFLQNGPKYVISKLNQLFLPNLNIFYTLIKGFFLVIALLDYSFPL